MNKRKGRLQQISDRVWVYRHDLRRLEPAVGLVLTSEGWLAVDGGNSPAHGRSVFEAMQEIRERPVRYVINTHRHFDHVFGNQAFGAPVIASRRCRDRFAKNIEGDWAPQRVQRWLHETMFSRVSTLNPRDFRGLRLIPPSLSFEGELSLDIDGSEVRLFSLAGAHSDDSIGVFLPYERVLFLGDALYLREGSEGRFLRLLEILERIAPLGVEVYVPGHEPPYGRLEFEKLWAYCRELLHAVRTLIYSGAGEPEVLKAVPFDRRFEGTSFLSPRFHRRMVQAAYHELASMERLC